MALGFIVFIIFFSILFLGVMTLFIASRCKKPPCDQVKSSTVVWEPGVLGTRWVIAASYRGDCEGCHYVKILSLGELSLLINPCF